MGNFDVLTEIDEWLKKVNEIEEPTETQKIGERPVGKVTYDKTKKLYTVEQQIQRTRDRIILELDELIEELKRLSKRVYSDERYKNLSERIYHLLLLSNAAKTLFSVSLCSEISSRLEPAEPKVRSEWKIVVTTTDEEYTPPGLKTETQQ